MCNTLEADEKSSVVRGIEERDQEADISGKRGKIKQDE